LGDFFENFSILEVEIGKNGPGILGVKAYSISKTLIARENLKQKLFMYNYNLKCTKIIIMKPFKQRLAKLSSCLVFM
jgi:hypothetical protein